MIFFPINNIRKHPIKKFTSMVILSFVMLLIFVFSFSILDAWLTNITYNIHTFDYNPSYQDRNSADFQALEKAFCADVSFIIFILYYKEPHLESSQKCWFTISLYSVFKTDSKVFDHITLDVVIHMYGAEVWSSYWRIILCFFLILMEFDLSLFQIDSFFKSSNLDHRYYRCIVETIGWVHVICVYYSEHSSTFIYN